MNPYWGTNIFQFLLLFFKRIFFVATGQLPLASDEIQIFVLSLVALSSVLVGAFLVVKKMTMLANSLSHTILLGIVLSVLLTSKASAELSLNFTTLVIAALLTALLTVFLTQWLTHVIKLQEDASIGLVFTTLFALGVMLVTLFTRNMHIGLEAVMGNADGLHLQDLKQVFYVAAATAIVITLFFKEFKLISFDPTLASSLGVSPVLFSYLLMVLTAFSAIGAFRAVGVLLFLALLVGPVLTARLLTANLSRLIAIACAIGVGSALCGVALSRHFVSVYQIPLSTSGMVVTLIGLCFGATLLLTFRKGTIKVRPLHNHVGS
jgi:manganese/zinc/iron transport system permease protein